MRMERKKKKGRGKWLPALCAGVVLCMAAAAVCGEAGRKEKQEASETKAQPAETQPAETQPAGAAAAAGRIGFEALRKENPDIFAWLYIPGAGIDAPVLQSEEADDYYESHDASGKENQEGALYTELANLKNMCDFNTVIHGKTLDSGGAFSKLHLFADQAFFDGHEKLYLYLPDNVLTYEIIASYPREDTSLIREYDFTYIEGCAQFLKDMYAAREMGKNIRAGWEELTPYNFLVTLTTDLPGSAGRQFVVIAVLTGDAAGKIERAVHE